MLRTHTCGDLSAKFAGKKAVLCGWAHSRRDHGGVIFIDLRDRYGLTQIVCDPSHNKKAHEEAEHIGREFVLRAEGSVRKRLEGMANPNMKTGEIELIVDKIEILNRSETPPIEIDDSITASEEARLKYRYLDLRRPVMQGRLMFRFRVAEAVREFFSKNDFIEVETPLLIRSTPEGARDYVVPSRIHPREFYALPQSPQIYKQILMIAGFDRYYQIARCLRDEDLRQDRQPEHTQLDLEMSFVDADDIFHLTEGLIKEVFRKLLNRDIKTPFRRIDYNDAMEKYCTDKPDIRFGMECCTVTDIVKESEFKVFLDAVKKGNIVKVLNAENCGEKLSRNQIDELIEFAKQNGAQGLA
ncbi:aspartate--tRNA ligase, partial [Candidatus Woesearchaeota archaeon]|nr:aspartate--tRNA ligase [Candidatus Woesearchaeota archaeon]